MKHLFKLFCLALTLGLFFTSCSNDDDNFTPQEPLGDYENGILISHEGNFSQPNASVSFVSYDLGTIENNIFDNVNSDVLGSVAQSINFNESFAYIVLNGSNTIQVVNRYTFETITTIDSGLDNPRYIAFANGKGYVTNWGDPYNVSDDYIAIMDLSTNTITSETISVGEGPEQIISNGNKLFVSHKGGFGVNNIISVVDANNTIETIQVNDVPDEMVFDNSGNLIVLSEGANQSWLSPPNITNGSLTRINVSDNSIMWSLEFADGEHPSLMMIEEDIVYYYMAGSLYKMSISDTTLPTTAEISGLNLYGMSINNSMLYGVDAADFVSDGLMHVYDLNTNNLINSVTLNVIPSKVYFN
ncbi:YncE family protein [Psychroserpens sp. S379A]|uniref:YncE family protein n=1 Tax=Psychroserpens sp. S379A TaxID=3415137 RepID=UPI003C7B29E8